MLLSVELPGIEQLRDKVRLLGGTMEPRLRVLRPHH